MLEKSWVRIPAPYTGWTFGHFAHLFVVKTVCLKRPKINEKEAGVGPFNKHLCKLGAAQQIWLFPKEAQSKFLIKNLLLRVNLWEWNSAPCIRSICLG